VVHDSLSKSLGAAEVATYLSKEPMVCSGEAASANVSQGFQFEELPPVIAIPTDSRTVREGEGHEKIYRFGPAWRPDEVHRGELRRVARRNQGNPDKRQKVLEGPVVIASDKDDLYVVHRLRGAVAEDHTIFGECGRRHLRLSVCIPCGYQTGLTVARPTSIGRYDISMRYRVRGAVNGSELSVDPDRLYWMLDGLDPTGRSFLVIEAVDEPQRFVQILATNERVFNVECRENPRSELSALSGVDVLTAHQAV
jgi:hypothetical protein